MNRLFVLGLVALVGCDTAGQLGFKFTADVTGPARLDLGWLASVLVTPSFFVSVAAYIGAFFIYMTLLRHAAIGPLFAASHLELVTVTAISATYFGERFNTVQALGCTMIVLGIAALALTESAEAQP